MYCAIISKGEEAKAESVWVVDSGGVAGADAGYSGISIYDILPYSFDNK